MLGEKIDPLVRRIHLAGDVRPGSGCSLVVDGSAVVLCQSCARGILGLSALGAFLNSWSSWGTTSTGRVWCLLGVADYGFDQREMLGGTGSVLLVPSVPVGTWRGTLP